MASPPDWQYHAALLGMRHAMELMLTGDGIDGAEAARIGFANRAYPADRLEEEVLVIAARVAGVPSELTRINKRSVHRAFDVWGARAAIAPAPSSPRWPPTPRPPPVSVATRSRPEGGRRG